MFSSSSIDELDLMSASHKTVFLLDHSPYFSVSCDSNLEITGFSKGRNANLNLIPLAPISKSLWTCSVEAALEYCRIVWDLFPENKYIRVIIGDDHASTANTWASDQQNIFRVFGSLSALGAPLPYSVTTDLKYSVVNGLSCALDALCEFTESQRARLMELENASEPRSKLRNNCRLICITSTCDNESIKNLETVVHRAILEKNVNAATKEDLLPIHHCHLIVFNTYPKTMDSIVQSQPTHKTSHCLTTEVYSLPAGERVINKLSELLMKHFDLASTTVTGIPMKEEANSQQSANYDVEILHPSAAHTALLKGYATEATDIRAVKDGAEYETITLRWSTPRNSLYLELNNCTTLHRITPVDVTSRPSSCLINFLLGGRTVLLEMIHHSVSTGATIKVTSHLLTCHGNELFIQAINTGRSILEDPPTISEGVGGRVPDYRVTDFAVFMKQNQLFPMGQTAQCSQDELPLSKAKKRLLRYTTYFPLTISSTILFNSKHMSTLIALMHKDELTSDEVVQCKQCIYNSLTLESKQETLAQFLISATSSRSKNIKREEQYNTFWKELEIFLKSLNISAQHNEVYIYMLECKKKREGDSLKKSQSKRDKEEIEQALRELEQCASREEDIKLSRLANVGGIRSSMDSPLSPPLQTVTSAGIFRNFPTKQKSLLEIHRAKRQKNMIQRPKLAGMLNAERNKQGNLVARLYPHLPLDGKKNKYPKPCINVDA